MQVLRTYNATGLANNCSILPLYATLHAIFIESRRHFLNPHSQSKDMQFVSNLFPISNQFSVSNPLTVGNLFSVSNLLTVSNLFFVSNLLTVGNILRQTAILVYNCIFVLLRIGIVLYIIYFLYRMYHSIFYTFNLTFTLQHLTCNI